MIASLPKSRRPWPCLLLATPTTKLQPLSVYNPTPLRYGAEVWRWRVCDRSALLCRISNLQLHLVFLLRKIKLVLILVLAVGAILQALHRESSYSKHL